MTGQFYFQLNMQFSSLSHLLGGAAGVLSTHPLTLGMWYARHKEMKIR